MGLFLPLVAEAQSSGCFTTNKSYCTFSVISCGSSYFSDTLTYGDPIATVCADKRYAEGTANIYAQNLYTCLNSYSSCDQRYNSLSTQANQCLDLAGTYLKERNDYYDIANKNYLAANSSAALVANYQKLEKRLRAACSTKCKKLKL